MSLLQIYQDQGTGLLIKTKPRVRKVLPGNRSKVSDEPAEIFRSYSVMVAPCWKS